MTWLVERGIGEDRALLVENGRALAARVRWPGELRPGQTVAATLVQRSAGASRGMAMTAAGQSALNVPGLDNDDRLQPRQLYLHGLAHHAVYRHGHTGRQPEHHRNRHLHEQHRRRGRHGKCNLPR